MTVKEQVHSYVATTTEEFLARHNLGTDCKYAADTGTYIALIDMLMSVVDEELIRKAMPHVFKK